MNFWDVLAQILIGFGIFCGICFTVGVPVFIITFAWGRRRMSNGMSWALTFLAFSILFAALTFWVMVGA